MMKHRNQEFLILLPLENIKILDLSRLAAGNMVSHMFADFGADVVKVEKPGK